MGGQSRKIAALGQGLGSAGGGGQGGTGVVGPSGIQRAKVARQKCDLIRQVVILGPPIGKLQGRFQIVVCGIEADVVEQRGEAGEGLAPVLFQLRLALGCDGALGVAPKAALDHHGKPGVNAGKFDHQAGRPIFTMLEVLGQQRGGQAVEEDLEDGKINDMKRREQHRSPHVRVRRIYEDIGEAPQKATASGLHFHRALRSQTNRGKAKVAAGVGLRQGWQRNHPCQCCTQCRLAVGVAGGAFGPQIPPQKVHLIVGHLRPDVLPDLGKNRRNGVIEIAFEEPAQNRCALRLERCERGDHRGGIPDAQGNESLVEVRVQLPPAPSAVILA